MYCHPHLWDQCCLLSTIQMTVGVAEFTDIALFCNVLCREGAQSIMVYLGRLLHQRVNLGLKSG